MEIPMFSSCKTNKTKIHKKVWSSILGFKALKVKKQSKKFSTGWFPAQQAVESVQIERGDNLNSHYYLGSILFLKHHPCQ